MLKVEKKKTGSRRKKLLGILAAVVVAIPVAGALLGGLPREKEEAVPPRVETGGSLVSLEPEQIRKIRIRRGETEIWEAERNEAGELRISGTEGWQLDETLGNRIEDALANLVYEDVLTEDEEEYRERLGEFGLETPALTAEAFYTDGSRIKILIGDRVKTADRQCRYMLAEGDPRLFAVAESLWEDLSVEPELLHPVVQPGIQADRIDRITVLNGEGLVQAEWMLERAESGRNTAEEWMISFPVRYPADSQWAENMKKNASNLRLGIYIGEENAGNLAEYGLEKPEFVIEIHQKPGMSGWITESGGYDVKEHEEETLRFSLGGRRNEMTDYCLYDGKIYSMNHFTSAAFTETNPLETASRFLVTIPPENLSSLQIERRNGGTDQYELVRREAEGSEEETTICLKNGEEIPYSAFQAAYERMMTVRASGRLPENGSPGETEVRYSFERLDGSVQILELREFDLAHDAVTLDGKSLFYVARNEMGELP